MMKLSAAVKRYSRACRHESVRMLGSAQNRLSM